MTKPAESDGPAEVVAAQDRPVHWVQNLSRQIIVQAVFWAAFMLLDRASTTFRMWAGTPAWYLPAGLSLAILVWGGARYLPIVLFAGVTAAVINYKRGLFSWAGLPGTVAMTLAYVAGAVWLRRVWRLDTRFRRLRDVGGLALFLILGVLPAALIGVLALFGDGLVTRADILKAIFNWWVSDSISVVSFAPILLLFAAPRTTAFLAGEPASLSGGGSLPSFRDAFETALELASIGLAIWLAFGFGPAVPYQPLYVLLFPIIWMAVRNGVSAAAAGVLTINVGVIIAAHLTRPDVAGLPRMQLVMLALAITGLCVGAVVSERSEAQEALRQSREDLQTVMASIPDYLWSGEVDRQGHWRYHYYSSVVEKITGRTPDFFLQGPDAWISTVHPDDRARMLKCYESLRAGQSEHDDQEYRILLPDGTVRWVLDSATVRREEGVIRVDGVVGDITQRKLAEEALRESEERFRTIFQTAGIGMALVERDGRGVKFNPALQRMLGYTEEELLGRTFTEFTHPDDRALNWSLHRELAAGQRDKYELEKRYFCKDGRVIWGHLTVSLVRDAASAPQYAVSMVEDITHRKRAENEARHAFERLRALAAHQESIREEERKRVARDIHDQLGQALTAIRIDSSALLRELPPASGPQAKKAESIMNLATETIQSVRRITSELRPGVLDDLGLTAAIEWAAEEFQSRTGTECKLELPDEDVSPGSECATALFRIFQETLTNVARHAGATQVKVLLARSNGDLILEVSDNGRGITEESHSRGQSLGILGMRERAELLGGRLVIRGSAGAGTTVAVRIPENGLCRVEP
jgi:PAS domain S-box-containing protein